MRRNAPTSSTRLQKFCNGAMMASSRFEMWPLASMVRRVQFTPSRYKAELIHGSAPENQGHVELATLELVSWFNHQRLLDPSDTGYVPPAETEAN